MHYLSYLINCDWYRHIYVRNIQIHKADNGKELTKYVQKDQ